MITEVKEISKIGTPEVLDGYLKNGVYRVPLDEDNRDYQEIQEWIGLGGIVEDAWTPEELEEYANEEIEKVYDSMVLEGQRVNQDNNVRISLDALLLISVGDAADNEVWMQDLYLTEVVQKPPAGMRQMLDVYGQNERDYVVERTETAGEYGWIITLIQSETVTDLSLAVCDAGGDVLEELVFGVCWRGVCVSTTLTATEEPLFYKFIADGDITGVLEQEADENGSGVVVWGDYD